MIYISTGGVKNRTAISFSKELLSYGVDKIELSGGVYSSNLLPELVALSSHVNFVIHNYFPPHEIPFVFNLGSLDSDIGSRSFNHAAKAIDWCSKIGSSFYSFHAGFLMDPGAQEIGKTISARALFKRDKSIEIFISRVIELNKIAEKLNITLMIENNVLSKNNSNEFKSNPLLMCSPEDCFEILNQLPNNIKLLIDVAHLKVSANSLNFNPIKMFDICEDRIGGYHLSDNNGFSDTNQAFTAESWFWRYLDPSMKYFSIEVYSNDINLLLQQKKITELKLNLK